MDELPKKSKAPTLGLTEKQIRSLPKGLYIKANKNSAMGGYFEFRKHYKGKLMIKTWRASQYEAAVDYCLDVLKKVNRNETIDEKKEFEITMSQACDIFWDRYAVKRPELDGFKTYLSRIRTHMGHLAYHAVTDEECTDFIEWLKKTKFHQERLKNTPPYNLANGTINLHRTCLISIFNSIPKWIKLGKLPKTKLPPQGNPASLTEKLSTTASVRHRALTDDEFNYLCVCATPRGVAIYENAVFTLLRYGDLREANSVLFKSTNALRGDTEKTKKYFEIAKTDEYEIQKVDWTNWRREFRAAVKKAGLEDFHFHDFRRTGATWMLRKGEDLDTIRQRLGHASLMQTQTYIGVMTGDKQKASDTIGGKLRELREARQGLMAPPTEIPKRPEVLAKMCKGPCNTIKALTDFYKNHSHADGHNSLCKLCSSSAAKASYLRSRQA